MASVRFIASVVLVVLAVCCGSSWSLKCGECFGEGVNCKPKGFNDDCEFCSKLTGKVVDPAAVPPYAMLIIKDNLPDISDEELKGKTLTLRKCASLDEIKGAGLEPVSGCKKHSNHLGFTGTSCLCKKSTC